MNNCLSVYKCLCDATRLRILNLLNRGPLCVCHIQKVLGETQVKISKQLAFMKHHGLVTSSKHANWRIYCLPGQVNPLLLENLKCLQDLAADNEREQFQKDLRCLKKIDTSAACAPATSCCD